MIDRQSAGDSGEPTTERVVNDPDLNDEIDEFLASQEAQSSLIHKAARESNFALASAALEMGLDINAQDAAGLTPLHLASTAEFADFLIQRGADIDSRSDAGNTALHLHVFSGHVEIVRHLLSLGADANALNNRWSSPIDEAESQSGTHPCTELLAEAGSAPGPLRSYIERTSPAFIPDQQATPPTRNRRSRIAEFAPLTFETHTDPWTQIRRFIESWLPNTRWHCGVRESDLDELAADGEFGFPIALRQFYLSGVFDWVLRQGLGLHLAELPKWWMNKFWAPPEAVILRANVDIVPVCYLECLRQYSLELDECDERDPPVREYADVYRINPVEHVHTFASRSFLEFVLYHVVREVVDAAPVQRVYQHTPPQTLRHHARDALTRMPFSVSEAGFLNSAYEGPDVIYLESRQLAGSIRCTGAIAARSQSALRRLIRSSRAD